MLLGIGGLEARRPESKKGIPACNPGRLLLNPTKPNQCWQRVYSTERTIKSEFVNSHFSA
jgi:hypothetical protein